MTDLGVVVVGRNEGQRLARCLTSVLANSAPLIYVDSGSTDSSVSVARSLGVPVRELDPARPFSAARARNEGFEQLCAVTPGLRYVQFVDGDCELGTEWLTAGRTELERVPEVAIACGHIRELHADASPYNRMCSLEWECPPGDVQSCGGNFMIRAGAFRAVGGFRTDVVAAEDDELCLRVRRTGGRIRLLAVEMVHHDAALLRFSQWWRRATRCGHAYALGHALHGSEPEHHFRRELVSVVAWGGVLPAAALAGLPLTLGASSWLLAAYPVLGLRIYRRGRERGWSPQDARLYAAFTVLSKLPGFLGAIRFHLDRWRGRHPVLIEHKEACHEPAPKP